MPIVVFSALVLCIFTFVVIIVALQQKSDDELMAEQAKHNNAVDIQNEHNFLCSHFCD